MKRDKKCEHKWKESAASQIYQHTNQFTQILPNLYMLTPEMNLPILFSGNGVVNTLPAMIAVGWKSHSPISMSVCNLTTSK